MKRHLLNVLIVPMLLSGCQTTPTTGVEKKHAAEQEPLGNTALIRSAYYQRHSDSEYYRQLPEGTEVCVDVICRIPRDVPFVKLPWPDSSNREDHDNTSGPASGDFGAHLMNHPELKTMQRGKAYRVRGVIGAEGEICYGAYHLEVASFEAID